MFLHLMYLILKVSYPHLTISIFTHFRFPFGAFQIVCHISFIREDLITLGGVLASEWKLIQGIHDKPIHFPVV